MSARVFANGALIEMWDDDARVVRRWEGQVVAERPYTPTEAAALDEVAAADVVRQRRLRALQSLSAALDVDVTYLAVPAPSSTQRAAQLDALTQQVAQLIRLATGQFQ